MPDPARSTLDPYRTDPYATGEAPTPSGADAVIDPFPGEFRVLRRLGEGAFGTVWLADDVNLDRKVAIKAVKVTTRDELGERVRQALRHDAHLLAKLHHPNVVQVYALRMCGDECYLVMQYVPGGSLRDRVRNSGPMPLRDALACIADVGDGLREVHACGIVHRDIKPENILWDPDKGRALLTDFGVSGHLANCRTITGTPAFMAPDAFQGKASAASDVYSLSVSLFYLLTGDLPFPVNTFDGLIARIKEGLPADDPRLKQFPAGVQEVLRSGLAFSPEARIGLDDLVPRFRRLAEDCGGNHRRPPVPAPSFRRRAKWLGSLAVVAMIAAMIAAIAIHSRRSSSDAWIPPGFEMAPGANLVAAGPKSLFSRILCSKDGLNVPFVLVAKNPDQPDDQPTFYIMENKVSSGLFHRFVESSSGSVAAAKWGDDPDSGQLPAMNVTCDEAFKFATWLCGKHGTLPSTDQWDKAAGRFHVPPSDGPFRGTWPQVRGQIAVDLKSPMPVGSSTADVSFYGCRDMAGNGQEWTWTAKDSAVKLPPNIDTENLDVYLRGKNYRAEEPLFFKDLGESEKLMVGDYFNAEPYTGFRVALAIPDDNLP